MGGFLKTVEALSVLDKVGEQGHTVDRQGRALDGMSGVSWDAKDDVSRAKAGAELRRGRANELETLLSKPTAEITAKNGRLHETYGKQQEMLADWILSQRTFKELAMKHDKLAGKTPEETRAEGVATKEIILDDQSQFGDTVTETERTGLRRKKAHGEKQAQATQNKATHSV